MEISLCASCGQAVFPAQVPGCSHCGAPAEQLVQQALPGPFALRNFIALQVDLLPGYPPPLLVGEVELVPGLVEQVLIAEAAEVDLQPGMPLWPRRSEQSVASSWVFVAAAGAAP